MARCSILYWQDIPSMVEARDGADSHKIQLSDRFQELIDMAAMRRGLAGSDGYLSGWHRVRQGEWTGDAAGAAAGLAADTEARYDEIRAAVLESLKA